MVLGLQIPTSGSIFADGKNILILEDSWLNILGYVPQSIYLFDDTIKNNIILKQNENFDKKLFDDCIKIAEIKDFIESLPNKEDTIIGESGSNLSGGQKQRLGIARALYKNSKIIIFDEATNALDLKTENKIFYNLENIKDKTFIVINHRDISKDQYKKINQLIFMIKKEKLIQQLLVYSFVMTHAKTFKENKR